MTHLWTFKSAYLVSSPARECLSTRYIDLDGKHWVRRWATARPTTPEKYVKSRMQGFEIPTDLLQQSENPRPILDPGQHRLIHHVKGPCLSEDCVLTLYLNLPLSFKALFRPFTERIAAVDRRDRWEKRFNGRHEPST